MNKKLPYYLELDGLRGIAVLLVMFYHFFIDYTSSNPLFDFVRKISLFGKTGVSLFFVLSGFLITRILLQQKHKPLKSFLRSFYLRRILRIFPLYYFFLIIYYFFLKYLFNTHDVPFNEQIWYWLFLQNYAILFQYDIDGPLHYWSLAVEEHFYIFWPFIIYFFSTKSIKLCVLFCCIVSILIRYLLIKNNIEESQFTFARLDELSLGAYLAILEFKKKLTVKENPVFIIFLLLSSIGLTNLIMKNGNYSTLDSIFRFSILAIFYSSLIAVILTLPTKNFLRNILKTKILLFTGKISFGLYVYHSMCYALIIYYYKIVDFFPAIILSFLLSYLLSYLSYQLMEVRFIELKKYFRY